MPPMPKITLAEFNRIASGSHNAGQVDFKKNSDGEFTGELARINSFVLQSVERLLSPGGKAALAANRAKAEAIVKAVNAKGNFSFHACYRLEAILSEFQKLGLELPPQINCFIQSMTRMQNMFAATNALIAEIKTGFGAFKEGLSRARKSSAKTTPRIPMSMISRSRTKTTPATRTRSTSMSSVIAAPEVGRARKDQCFAVGSCGSRRKMLYYILFLCAKGENRCIQETWSWLRSLRPRVLSLQRLPTANPSPKPAGTSRRKHSWLSRG